MNILPFDWIPAPHTSVDNTDITTSLSPTAIGILLHDALNNIGNPLTTVCKSFHPEISPTPL